MQIAPCLAEFDGDVGGLAFHPDGRLLVCTAARPGRCRRRWPDDQLLAEAEGEPLHCLTAVAAAPDGSHLREPTAARRHGADDWCVDLMERNTLGRIVACGPALDDARVLLRDLHYPAGVGGRADGDLWFTESLRHRLSRARDLRPRRHRRRRRS